MEPAASEAGDIRRLLYDITAVASQQHQVLLLHIDIVQSVVCYFFVLTVFILLHFE